MSKLKGEDWAMIIGAAFACYVVYQLVVKPASGAESEASGEYNAFKCAVNTLAAPIENLFN